MIDLAFIQQDPDTKFPFNETAYLIWAGCRWLGIETRMFDFFQDIQRDLTPTTLVQGRISVVLQSLRHLGAPHPDVPDCPESLRHLFGRRVWPTTLGAIRADDRPVFIKPLKTIKAFTGHVRTSEVSSLIQTAEYPDDFEVLAQDLVDFVSEYRILVHNGLMIACRHYRGDFTVFPDMQVAFQAIREYKPAPCGYSLDLGVTRDGRTLVVEVNDGFSLGAYGAPAVPYTQMIIDRWCQMAGAPGVTP